MKIKFLKRDYLLLFLLIIQASSASIIANSDIFIVLSSLWSIVIFFKVKRSIDSFYLFSFFVFIITCLFYYFLNEAIDLNTWIGLYLRILFTYNIVRILGNKLPEYFIQIIRIISIISLFLFILQLIIPTYFFSINNFLELGKGNNSNSLIFNYSLLHKFRNCGPMWEPGVYAALLVLSLFLYNIHNPGQLFKRNNIPIFLALITTFSTTGYITLLIIIVLHFSKSKSFGIFAYLFLIIIFLGAYNLEIGYNKIENQYSSLDKEINNINENSGGGYRMSISRFASYVVDFKVFKQRPFFGFGADILTTSGDIYYKEYGANINRSSGLMLLLVRFGLIGFICYFYFLYKSLYLFSDVRSAVIGLLLIIIILFSSPMILSPLTFLFFFIHFSSLKSKVKKKDIIKQNIY